MFYMGSFIWSHIPDIPIVSRHIPQIYVHIIQVTVQACNSSYTKAPCELCCLQGGSEYKNNSMRALLFTRRVRVQEQGVLTPPRNDSNPNIPNVRASSSYEYFDS